MPYREVDVVYDNGLGAALVGRLAASGPHTVFEYDSAWVERGIELAPFKLPTKGRSFTLDPRDAIASTFGLFADSLPDGWGLLIMDRSFKKLGNNRNVITPLDRLAFLGNHTMGALCYHPPARKKSGAEPDAVNVGEMAREAYQLYEGRIEEAGRLLAQIGGSPGGARPKALIGISDSNDSFVSGTHNLPAGYSHWFVKFSAADNRYDGVLEFIYNRMAKAAGICVPENMLITDDAGIQHIATKRFDRLSGNRRRHIATVCGLLHADHMAPSLDYAELLKLSWKLTNSAAQAEEQFRRAAFNMFAVNRDDHSKNHGYVMSDEGLWELSPAYDLTYSSGPGGEHWTSYNGEGRNPRTSDLLKIASIASISKKNALLIIDEVCASITTFSHLAKENNIPVEISSPIAKQLETVMASAWK